MARWIAAMLVHPVVVNDATPGEDPLYRRTPRATGDLVVNYEDRRLADVFSPEYAEKLGVWSPGRQVDVVVVRDLFNWAASRLALEPAERWWLCRVIPDVRTEVGRRHALALWREYASELLAPRPGVVAVVFNMWHRSGDYRRQLAKRLGLAFSDAGRQTVHGIGKSSFEDTRFNGRAAEMAVLDRWRGYAHDGDWGRLTADPELRELSLRLFPAIRPGGGVAGPAAGGC